MPGSACPIAPCSGLRAGSAGAGLRPGVGRRPAAFGLAGRRASAPASLTAWRMRADAGVEQSEQSLTPRHAAIAPIAPLLQTWSNYGQSLFGFSPGETSKDARQDDHTMGIVLPGIPPGCRTMAQKQSANGPEPTSYNVSGNLQHSRWDASIAQRMPRMPGCQHSPADDRIACQDASIAAGTPAQPG